MGPRSLPPVPHPQPGLDDLDLPLLPFSGSLHRIHRLENDPAFWGRTGGCRFDAPGHEYGVLYAAGQFDGAFIETFGDVTPHVVSAIDLASRGLAGVETLRPLRLVDLAGPGLSRLGLDARIFAGDHTVAQEWSRALWRHPLGVDGLWYVARHDGEQHAAALFERARPAVTFSRCGSLLDLPNLPLIAAALERYRFALLP